MLAENCRNLISVDISYTGIGDVGVVRLCQCCPELIVLVVTFCVLTDISLFQVASLSELQWFDSGNDVEHQAEFTINGLILFARSCANLKVLNLRLVDNITNEFVITLARAHPDLRDLDVRGSEITDVSLIELSILCPNLRKLDVTGCKLLTDSSTISIANNCSYVEIIKVSDCLQLTDASILATANCCPELKSLYITNCTNITEASLLGLFDKCRNLQCTVLWNVVDIPSFVPKIQHLHESDYNCNSIYNNNNNNNNNELLTKINMIPYKLIP
jgi:hypothetical protein